MSNAEKSNDDIRVKISAPVMGQVAVGKEITQVQAIGANRPRLTEVELSALHQVFNDLKLQVEAAAPPEKKDAALERIEELSEAVTAKEPDLTTAEYVKRWFIKNLPGLAGAVTGVILHPIVGKLVAAAGDALAGEFTRRFGEE